LKQQKELEIKLKEKSEIVAEMTSQAHITSEAPQEENKRL